MLKCHCNEKIFNPILIVKEQHLRMRLNGVFSFSIPCFVSEIFRFLRNANYVPLDVIYSRIINYIYKMMNISINIKQNSFKLCMNVAICYVHTILTLFVYDMVGFGIIKFKPQNKYFNLHYFFTQYDDLNARNAICWCIQLFLYVHCSKCRLIGEK